MPACPGSTTGGSRRADELFAVVGFGYRERPKLAAPGIFEDVLKDGVAAYAQSLDYNGNLQRGKTSSLYQAVVGWDTLNWVGEPVPEWVAGVDPAPDGNTPASYFRARAPLPEIRLNWQTMMVPATRIADAP